MVSSPPSSPPPPHTLALVKFLYRAPSHCFTQGPPRARILIPPVTLAHALSHACTISSYPNLMQIARYGNHRRSSTAKTVCGGAFVTSNPTNASGPGLFSS